MVERIIKSLGENYNPDDNKLLVQIIDEICRSALSISNRTDTNGLEDIIVRTSVIKYLQRGCEGTTSYNEMGLSANYIDPIDYLKNEIIKLGKRKIW